MHGKSRRDQAQDQQGKNRFVEGRAYPLPIPVPALLKQEGSQGYQGYYVDGGYRPALDGTTGKWGESA